MREIIFEVTEAPEGGYNARALGHNVFTQGEDWDDLRDMVRDAVLCHFDGREAPRVIRFDFREIPGVFREFLETPLIQAGRPLIGVSLCGVF